MTTQNDESPATPTEEPKPSLEQRLGTRISRMIAERNAKIAEKLYALGSRTTSPDVKAAVKDIAGIFESVALEDAKVFGFEIGKDVAALPDDEPAPPPVIPVVVGSHKQHDARPMQTASAARGAVVRNVGGLGGATPDTSAPAPVTVAIPAVPPPPPPMTATAIPDGVVVGGTRAIPAAAALPPGIQPGMPVTLDAEKEFMKWQPPEGAAPAEPPGETRGAFVDVAADGTFGGRKIPDGVQLAKIGIGAQGKAFSLK